jgi:hypothetical protein
MALQIYRRENLVEHVTYKAPPDQIETLIELLRMKWAMLREKGWAADNPAVLLRGQDTATEIFSWKSSEARARAAISGTDWYAAQIETLAQGGIERHTVTEVLRGFQANFPDVGGDELLTGVCDCVLDIDGVLSGYTFRATDGVVLMHRSGRADQDKDGHNEMYLHIQEHGCKGTSGPLLGNMRIVQNHALPNDGLVKSLGEGPNDFPAMAIWRVAWKIVTSFGTFMTDPNKPLVFGPSRVTHYPPVGTEFHSSTGPVDLLEEASGQKVGTLTPLELTAFDIRHTMDDSRPTPLLDEAPKAIFDLLDHHLALQRSSLMPSEDIVRRFQARFATGSSS